MSHTAKDRRKFHFGYFLLLANLIALPQAALAQDYYISGNDGDNRENGLSWTTAWKTLEPVTRLVKAGDTVTIRKSRQPYEHLRILNSGTADNPIHIHGEYATDPPIISAQILEWLPTPYPGVWKSKDPRRDTYMLKEDNLELEVANSPECINGHWYWNAGALYYKPTVGTPSDHVVWTNGGGGSQLKNAHWIVIENLYFLGGGGAGIALRGASHNTIRNIHVKWHWAGIDATSSQRNTFDNVLVEETQEGIYLSAKSGNNTVTNCRIYRVGLYPYWTKGDRHAIAVGGQGPNPDNLIEGCDIGFNGGHVAAIAFRAPGTIFRKNHIHDNHGSGLFITSDSDGSIAMQNVIAGNGHVAVTAGIKGIAGLSVRNSKQVQIIKNHITNNTVSSDTPYKNNIYAGKHGGLDIDGIKGTEMPGITITDNVVTGTIGGPDVQISSRPRLKGMTITPRDQGPQRILQ